MSLSLDSNSKKRRAQNTSSYGYIYCFSNVSMPSIYKCGMTTRTPLERLHEANTSDTWRPPTPFIIEFAKRVQNPRIQEYFLHNSMHKYRVHARREYFQISLDDIKALFDMVDGELWVPPVIDIPPSRLEARNWTSRVPKNIPIYAPVCPPLGPDANQMTFEDELQLFACSDTD